MSTDPATLAGEVNACLELYTRLRVAVQVLLDAIEFDGYGDHFDHVIENSYTNVKELLK
jgi:hypothetical protein